MKKACIVLIVAFAAGCASQHDLVAENDITVQTDAGANSMMVGPRVVQAGRDLLISGAVMRKPGNDTPMAGHVDIVATDASGKITDQFSVALQPHAIPIAGDRSSSFTAEELATLPKGTSVKATFVDELHPTIDYLTGLGSGAGGMTEEHSSGGGGGSHSGSGGASMHLQGGPHGISSGHAPSSGGHGGGRR